jgi:hypothetical protein
VIDLTLGTSHKEVKNIRDSNASSPYQQEFKAHHQAISETDRLRATEEGRKGGTDIRGSAEGKRGKRRALFWGSQIIPL